MPRAATSKARQQLDEERAKYSKLREEERRKGAAWHDELGEVRPRPHLRGGVHSASPLVGTALPRPLRSRAPRRPPQAKAELAATKREAKAALKEAERATAELRKLQEAQREAEAARAEAQEAREAAEAEVKQAREWAARPSGYLCALRLPASAGGANHPFT